MTESIADIKNQPYECQECGSIVRKEECEFCNRYDETFASIPTLFTYDEDGWRYPLLRDLDET